jgi:hypothetical protein
METANRNPGITLTTSGGHTMPGSGGNNQTGVEVPAIFFHGTSGWQSRNA